MPPAKQQTLTMAEGLQTMLGEVAQLQVAPDADIPFLLDLQQRIVIKIHPQLQGGQGQGQPQIPPGAVGGQGPGVPMPGAAPSSGADAMAGALGPFAGAGGFPGGGAPASGMAGMMQAPELPPVDELRRMLSGKQ